MDTQGKLGAQHLDRRVPVVLLHGALRTRVGLWPSAWALGRAGLRTKTFGYATRHGSLEQHARALAALVERWLADECPVPVLGFFTHSMGGLVVRAYLARPESRRHARQFRVVMLSPPNRGSILARSLFHRRSFRWLYGRAVDELTGTALEILPSPDARASVLILAGGGPDGRGYNPAIAGNNDGVVAVDEMGLPGHEPVMVGGIHGWLQWRPDVLRRAADFLRGNGPGSG